MAKITHIDAVCKSADKRPRAIDQIRAMTPAQEPDMGTKDWVVWFVDPHVDQLVRPMSDNRLGANDATIWARLLAAGRSLATPALGDRHRWTCTRSDPALTGLLFSPP